MADIGHSPVRKCSRLTPQQADSLFFPGPGGKSNKAKSFCSDCPARALCLKSAIEEGLEGFYAGTTLDERKEMVVFITGISVIQLVTMEDFAPPVTPVGTANGRRVARRKRSDPYQYLDEIEPRLEELV